MAWHILLAGDGTTYSLPNTPQIKKMYLQGRKTGRGEQALARGVVLKDIFNDVLLASNMECYGKDEIRLLLDEINALPDDILAMLPVLLLDRKFCAYTLLAPLMRNNIGFIIRVKERFNADVDSFMASGKKFRDMTLTPAATTIKKLKRLYGKDVPTQFPVRLVRLSDNIVVMTSITDVPLRQSEGNTYQLRWNVETTIGFIKNNLQVEIFSSSIDNSMRQDFYARTIQYNLLSFLCHQAAELRHDDNDRRINRNIALGILKLEFGLFIIKDNVSFKYSLTRMLNLLLRFTIRVRPNRHNPRLFRKVKHSGKYITLHNYREAI
ncbi:MAG: transposase [Barnesiella sp.]|nr:transposase [Barnesiella sp.]